MRRIWVAGVFFIGTFVTLVTAARADEVRPAESRLYAARSGPYRFRVLPQGHNTIKPATGVLFRTDGKTKQVIWKRKLVNLPTHAYVSNDGRYVVTADTWGSAGYEHALVIYDGSGRTVRDLRLEDLLTRDEIIEKVSWSVSNRVWRYGATFTFSRDGRWLDIKLHWGRLLRVRLADGQVTG